MNRKSEIEAVKKLGELIGYRNMMDIACALWAIQESDDSMMQKHLFDNFEKNKYTYWITYDSEKEGGNISCTLHHNPPTFDDIRKLQKQLKEELNLPQMPLIKNWQLLG